MSKRSIRIVHSGAMVGILYGVHLVTWRPGVDYHLQPDVDIDDLVGLVDFNDLKPPAHLWPLPAPPPVP
jgi:hypothetical protein